MSNGTPLIQFGSDTDQAPVLQYNIPQPTSYPATAIHTLDYPREYFSESARQEPETTLREAVKNLDISELKSRVETGVKQGLTDPVLFDRVNTRDPIIRTAMATTPAERTGIIEIENDPISDGGVQSVSSKADLLAVIEQSDYLSTEGYLSLSRKLDPEVIAAQAKAGRHLTLQPNLYGDYVPRFISEPETAQPQLALVEQYKLSSYLGNYGAGRTVKTFSLFPGERTQISIKKYSNRTRQKQEASSILETASREAAVEFETAVEQESEQKSAAQQEDESYWKVAGEAGVNLGVFGGKFESEGGAKSKLNASRENAARIAVNAVGRNSDTISAKREVDIDETTSETETIGEEETVERVIENINVSRTLNLVFRQLSQEFITLLHLTDVRLAYTNGYPGSYREVPLYRIDELVNEVISEPHRSGMQEQIIQQVNRIYDYRDTFVDDFIVQTDRGDDELNYWRINKEKTMTYQPADSNSDGFTPTVDGVIMGSTRNVLRSDGLIVDALLGRGEGLDEYSQGLQTEAARAQQLENEQLQSELETDELARSIVDDSTDGADRASKFEKVFKQPEKEDEEP